LGICKFLLVTTQQVWVVGNVKVYVIRGDLELCCPNLKEFNLVHVIFSLPLALANGYECAATNGFSRI